ncbi:phosphotransferase [Actinoplanes sp. M2I2]|uniref:phosphotransferase n=1 Tax=Actinoplanes sp. M2I2 TaxID=1734444 RepID=UPI0020211FD3|nr:phosphotransferase [Actinoplanes sp. M2I2]
MNGWHPAELERLAADLCQAAHLPAPTRADTIREWHLSGVRRLHLPGRTLILKYARPPFANEPRALATLAAAGIPVPELHAHTRHGTTTGMLLTDLGPALRAPSLPETAAAAAAHLHRPDPLPGHPTINTDTLKDAPGRALALVDQAHATGAIADPGELHTTLKRLDHITARRAADADRPPYGICHGELHPTAIHISAAGQHILDVPLAHTGPGLLDLASILGMRTTNVPAMDALINAHVQAGGHRDTQAPRAGLAPARWALGWHRVISALWHLHQATDQTHTVDQSDTAAAERQLRAAVDLLE